MRNLRAALAAALALAFPAAATVTGNQPPSVYSCNGSTTTYTVGWPYLAASNVVATVTTATVPTVLALGTDYTVSPSTAPSVGTLKLTAGSTCPNGSTLTISRSVPLTQPQSFRTGPYSGSAQEQAFDRIEMELQDTKTAQTARDSGQDTAIAAAINPTPVTVNSNSLILATGATTSRTLADRAKDFTNAKDYLPVGYVVNGTVDYTTQFQAAINSLTTGSVLWIPPGNFKIAGLTIPVDGIEIRGAGKGATTFTVTSTTATAFKSANQALSRSYLKISNLSINGPGSGTGVGIDYSGFSDSVVENVYIADFGTQLLLDASVAGLTLYDSFYHVEMRANAGGTGLTGVKMIRSANAMTFVACKWHRLATQVLIGDVNAATPNQIDFFNAAFEAADTVSVNIIRGQSIYISGGRFEQEPLGVQTAADNLVRGVVIDAPYWNAVTTAVSDAAGAVTIRSGGTGGPTSIMSGNSTYAGPNLLPNAKFESWDGATSLPGWASVSSANWNTTGEVNKEGTVIHGGAASAKGGDGTTTFKGISGTAQIPVDPTKPYTLTFWWTTPDATHVGMRYAFRLFDASNVVITTGTVIGLNWTGDINTVGTITNNLTYSGGFNAHIMGGDKNATASNVMQRESYLALFPPGTASVRLGVMTGSTSTGASVFFYMDDAYFTQGAALLQPMDAKLGDSGDQQVYGALTIGPRSFANLGTPANGQILYCSDCTIANPCAGSGTGALAKRLNGAWVCN